MADEPLRIEVLPDVARGIVGTLAVDIEIADERGDYEAKDTFERWQEPFVEALREEYTDHFDSRG